MKNVKTGENLRYPLLRGDREQVDRSKDLVQKLSGRTWHSLKQVLSCDTEMSKTWSPTGKTEKIQAKVCWPEKLQCSRALYFVHRTFWRSSQTK